MAREHDVKQERSGWRDLRLSERHRAWGVNCPAVDIDLFLEYDNGKAAALIEYKHEYAPPQQAKHPSYRALIDLADRAGVPCYAVRYADNFMWWTVIPLNAAARIYVPERITMNEPQWVGLLYRLRGRSAPELL